MNEVPRALRGLTPACISALQPLGLDRGPYERPPHGYRVHTALARFSWAEESVQEKIEALPRTERKQARRAFTFLMRGDSRSEYRNFVKQHEDPSAADCKRPLQMLEAPCQQVIM